MERLAAEAADALAGAPADEVIAWAVKTFGRRICITSSMTDAVLVNLVSKHFPGVDVLFLDTAGYLTMKPPNWGKDRLRPSTC